MSSTGTPSVIAQMTLIPASSASRIASAVKAAGTKIIVAFAPVFSTASMTVSNTGSPSTFSPALPGVTPPTICVPYSLQPFVWNAPALPVIPWQITRVDLSTSMLIGRSSFHCGDNFLRRIGQIIRRRQLHAAFAQNFLPFLDLGTFQPNNKRHAEPHCLARRDDGRRDRRATSDSAKDIDQNALHVRVGKNNPKCLSHLLLV